MILYKLAGFIFVGLATLGVFLPLLPTTPFLLVAAGCFARSSAKWHRWLLSNRLFGPMIKRWEETRSISYSTKIVALVSMGIFGGSSIIFILADPMLKLVGVLLMGIGLYSVLRLNVGDPTS